MKYFSVKPQNSKGLYMINPQKYGHIQESYTLELTVEVVMQYEGENKTIKLEVLKDEVGKDYVVHGYKDESFVLQSSYPWSQANGYETRPRDVSLWEPIEIPHKLPPCKTAQQALETAVSWLGMKTEPNASV